MSLFSITVFRTLAGTVIGTFQYAAVPRIGEWFLIPSNDGSGRDVWVVDMVLYFPVTGARPPEICLYASEYDRRYLEKSLIPKSPG